MDDTINLDDRLNIAYGALISQDFPVAGKEQIIIDWFPDCLKANEKNSKTILKSLIKCLRSDSLSTLNEAFDATKLVEVSLSTKKLYYIFFSIKHRKDCLV